jgi:hypothetical protein
VISPYARGGFVDHQLLSYDVYLRFIEDRFLGGQRLDPATDGRPDARSTVREALPAPGGLRNARGPAARGAADAGARGPGRPRRRPASS